MMYRRSNQHTHNTADLEQLMTAAPMDQELHAQILRKQIKLRRAIEDAQEAARYNNLDLCGAS
jgi:hypothetical protein